VIIQRMPAPPPAPIYLRVPPGYARHWSRHCHEYHACGVPVYFVQDRWYNEVYVPRYRERYRRMEPRHDGRRDQRGEDRRGGRRDYGDDYRERPQERGHGHGRPDWDRDRH
jgi:hypothetical protein